MPRRPFHLGAAGCVLRVSRQEFRVSLTPKVGKKGAFGGGFGKAADSKKSLEIKGFLASFCCGRYTMAITSEAADNRESSGGETFAVNRAGGKTAASRQCAKE
jgi:hypothetical protein